MSTYDPVYERVRRDHVVRDVDGGWYFYSEGGGTWSAYHLRIAADVLRDLNAAPSPVDHHQPAARAAVPTEGEDGR